jgi:hypothetical protein
MSSRENESENSSQGSNDIILNAIKEIDIKGIQFILFFYFFSYIIVVRKFVKTVMILF